MSKVGGSSKGLSYSDRQRPEILPPIPRHRFQKSGNKEVYEMKNTENAYVMRVDMPGCSASSFVCRVDEGKNVHFSAHEPDMPDYGHDGRKYEGTVVCNPLAFEVKEAKAEFVDGVMWLTIPKIPRTEEPRIMSLRTEKMLKVKLTSDMFRSEPVRLDS